LQLRTIPWKKGDFYFKAARLQMSQNVSRNVSRKSILRKMYLDFKEGKSIQDPSDILHVMCGLRMLLQ
jgi:hypothetical protein